MRAVSRHVINGDRWIAQRLAHLQSFSKRTCPKTIGSASRKRSRSYPKSGVLLGA